MKVGEKRFMSINLFFLHSYAYEISGEIYLFSYSQIVSVFSFFLFPSCMPRKGNIEFFGSVHVDATFVEYV